MAERAARLRGDWRNLHQRLRAIQQRRRIGKSSAREIQHPGDANGNQRAKTHDPAGHATVKIVRPHQRKAGEKSVHRVVPRERGQNPPAQHHQARDDADQSNLDPARVRRLLRIIRVQKAPRKRRTAPPPGISTWCCAAGNAPKTCGRETLRWPLRKCRWSARQIHGRAVLSVSEYCKSCGAQTPKCPPTT